MGVQQLREGNRASGGVITPANAYPASDGWVMILAADNHRWVKLCDLMGRSDLAADERFKKLAGRSRHRDAIDEIIGSWTSTRTRQELMELLSAKDIICGAVKELPEVMADAHMHERGALREINHPQLGPMTIFSSPVRFNGQANAPRSPSPAHGADNDRFYREELGFSPAMIAELRERKVI
jgi:crotonobetainyl-CoA:carnitine CoA-transferase CaiB-like acyl-CoA transferase